MAWGAEEELVGILRQTPEILDALVAGVSADVARAKATPGSWSIVEVVGHLNDAEGRSIERVREIVENDRPLLSAYNQDEMVERLRYQDQDLAEVLASFNARRRDRLALLESLPSSAWDRAGVHPVEGELTIRQITTHMAGHDVNHLAQVAALTRGA